MKKTFFFLIALLFIYTSHAQNVGIGTTTPLAKLHIFTGASGAIPFSSTLSVESNAHTYINLLSPGANETGLLFAIPASPYHGAIIYNNINTLKGFQLRTNGNLTRMIIDSTGSVGIGPSAPNTSAQLDVTSTTKGMLPPRMTQTDRNNIATPVAGLMIWCKDCGVYGEMQVYNGIVWRNMIRGTPAGIPTIGDSDGGGIVAYILQPGDPGYIAGEVHGLIAGISDLVVSQWGCFGTLINGTSTALGTGQLNTTAIVNGCGTAGIAARICNDLVQNGYDDWYLPSKDELNKLYLNKFAIGGFGPYNYWSSSEFDINNAWRQNFDTGNGLQTTSSKANTAGVRAVRAF